MNTVIDITEQPCHPLVTEEVVLLLNQKIEDSVLQQRHIIVGISNLMMECRNTIDVDDYEIDDTTLYLNAGHFELHIHFDDIEREYDEINEQFIFKCDGVEIVLYFL